jgi:hypothetical protein
LQPQVCLTFCLLAAVALAAATVALATVAVVEVVVAVCCKPPFILPQVATQSPLALVALVAVRAGTT